MAELKKSALRGHTTGGLAGGSSRNYDGRLDVKVSVPGMPLTGTNPEQLFAAGWPIRCRGRACPAKLCV